MPMERTESYGTETVAAASTTLRLTLELAGGATFTTFPFDVADLPRIRFWMRHTGTAAGVGVLYTAQYAVGEVAIAGVPALQWLDFAPNGVLPFDVPVIVPFDFPAKFVRLTFIVPAVAVTQTIEVVIGATQ